MKGNIYGMEWNDISFINLCHYCKDNWIVQYKMPNVDIWLNYDIHKSTFISFIVFCQMEAEWRYRLNIIQ